MSSSFPLLKLEHVVKSFETKTVLKDLHLELQAGEFLCLLGPSGCGKSTLLRILAGLEKATSGRITWPTEKNFAFVFQESELLPWRSALENVRLPLELNSDKSREEQNKKALEALQRVGLADAARAFPQELSGGMKMRVSIARALISIPRILFMDEPFSSLDEVTRFDLQNQLRELAETERLTVVFVTHSSFEAAFLADRVLLMANQGGHILLDQKIHYLEKRKDSLRQSQDYQKQVALISAKMRESFL